MKMLRAFAVILLVAGGIPALAGEQNIKESVSSDLAQIIPYIVTGAGWTTSITIVNAEETTASVEILLFNEGGESVSLEAAQLGRIGDHSTVSIPGHSSVTIDFLPTADYQVNWMKLDPGFDFVSTTAKLRYSQYFNTVDYGWILLEHQALEIAANVYAPYGNELLGSFDTRNGDDILYLVNPFDYYGDAHATVHATLADGSTRDVNITVAPMTRVAVSLQESFGVTHGSIDIVSGQATLIATPPYVVAVILDLDGCSFSMSPLVPPAVL